MASLEPLPYTLDLDCPVPWPESQEDTNTDYPFPLADEESPEDFVIRRYLETLWLPESIMPLRHFVKSLRRFSPTQPREQSLRATLNPLLLSVRATQEKYRHELPRILQDGGGAGEIEETMMWFAWSKEKFDAEGSDAEEAWKKGWMEKLERREVQIQILLYFYILSLPPSQPSTPVPSSSNKRKRKPLRGPPSPMKSVFPLTASVEAAVVSSPPTSTKSFIADADESLGLEDRLEFFMDRLSLWQLVSSLDPSGSSHSSSSQHGTGEKRDWMQIFCEEIVEPLFKDQLPELCKLLRTKVFPHNLFSDNSDRETSPPLARAAVKNKAKGKRPASPLSLQELEKPKAIQSRAGSSQPTDSGEPGAPQQHRSRSRSVSVSVEEVRARGASRGGVASSKTLFKGEVEMKRTSSRGSKLFKPSVPEPQNRDAKQLTRQDSRHIFPSATASRPRSPSQPRTFAVDTPVKKQIKTEDGMPHVVMDSPDRLLLTSLPQCDANASKMSAGSIIQEENDGEEEDGVVSLFSGAIFAADTPVKKRF